MWQSTLTWSYASAELAGVITNAQSSLKSGNVVRRRSFSFFRLKKKVSVVDYVIPDAVGCVLSRSVELAGVVHDAQREVVLCTMVTNSGLMLKDYVIPDAVGCGLS